MTQDQLPLLKRDPVTLDGITPVFGRVESLLGYNVEKVRINSGWGFGPVDHDEVRPEAEYEDRYSLTILGVKIEADLRQGYGVDTYNREMRDIIPLIANQFLKNKDNEKRYPEVWAFLITNADDLSMSNRYWAAVHHLNKIQNLKDKIKEIETQIEHAGYAASIRAFEIREGRRLTDPERRQLWAEFSGNLPYGQ